MTTLVLIRHAQTALNDKHIVQGQSLDPDLSAAGVNQLPRLCSALKSYPPSTILTSPMKRALSTAKCLRDQHRRNLPVHVLEELTERNFSIFEGMTRDKLLKFRAEQGWSNGDPTGIFPASPFGVEPSDIVTQRVLKALSRVAVNPGGDQIVYVVSHAGTIRAFIYSMLGIHDDQPCAFKIRAASFVAVRWFDACSAEILEIWPNSIQ